MKKETFGKKVSVFDLRTNDELTHRGGISLLVRLDVIAFDSVVDKLPINTNQLSSMPANVALN